MTIRELYEWATRNCLTSNELNFSIVLPDGMIIETDNIADLDADDGVATIYLNLECNKDFSNFL